MPPGQAPRGLVYNFSRTADGAECPLVRQCLPTLRSPVQRSCSFILFTCPSQACRALFHLRSLKTNADFGLFFSSSPAPSRSIPTSTGQCLFDTEAKDQNGDQSPTIGTAQSTFLLAEIETTPANSCVDDLQPSSGHPLFPPRPWQPPPEHTTPPFTDGRLCPPLPATRVPQRTVSDGIPIAGNQRRVIPTKFLPFPDDAAFSRRAAAAPANPAESGDEN